MIINKDTQLRDEILAPYSEQMSRGGIARFKGVPLDVLQRLIDLGFVYMGKWNACPGVADLFLPFLKKNPLFTSHGYAVSGERKDSRIDVEGVESAASLTRGEIIDFANTFRRADDFDLTADHARCWYD
jgi:hypothetical protein